MIYVELLESRWATWYERAIPFLGNRALATLDEYDEGWRTRKDKDDDHDPVIVTRKNNESVVMMSLEDFESLKETAYLLQSPKNMRRLLESFEELEAGRGQQRNLAE